MDASYAVIRGLTLENSILGFSYPISWKSYQASAIQLRDAMGKTAQDVGTWEDALFLLDGQGMTRLLTGLDDLSRPCFRDAKSIQLNMTHPKVNSRVSLLYDQSTPAQLAYEMVNPTDEAMDVFDEIMLTRGPFKRVLHNYSAGVCVMELDLRNPNVPSTHHL